MPVSSSSVPPTARGGDSVISAVKCRVYKVPTDQPEADGTLEWSDTTMVVVEVHADGVSGIGWTYAGAGCRDVVDSVLAPHVVGSDAMDIPGINEGMVRACRNLGRPGLVSCAISACDTALWDLKARMLHIPLSSLFGLCRSAIPLYGSGGFTTYSDATTQAQLEGWVGDLGMNKVKIKIGESWGREEHRDLDRIALTRNVVGDEVEVLVDANGGYSVKQAVRVGQRAVTEHGVVWFEEPVSSDNLAGLHEVRGQVSADVAAGEYGYDETYFARMVAADAVDCLQVDVTRCGGFTCWLRVASIAAASGLDVSAHCAPALHVQVCGSVPNLRHIEYFHDHARLETKMFDGILTPENGELVADPSVPGNGYRLKQADADPYRIA
jgi:L-alanine-DL-glutamate epimerase-like enolase superfamily enzyme